MSLRKTIFGMRYGGEVQPPSTVWPHNTVIDGLIESYGGTVEDLAFRLQLSVSDIPYFERIGDRVLCHISVEYAIPGSAFPDASKCVNFYDFDGKVTNIDGFNGNDYVRRLYFPNATSISAGTNNAFYSANYLEFMYAPRVTTIGTTVANNNVFQYLQTDAEFFFNPFMETSNGGAEEGDVAYLRGTGALINYARNFTKPEPITDAVLVDTFTSAVQITFTPPPSANTIQRFVVFVNGVINSWGWTDPSEVYATGLTPGTDYEIQVVAVDLYYNMSELSNSVFATTAQINPVTNITAETNTATVLKLNFSDTNKYFRTRYFDVYVDGVINSQNITDASKVFAVGLQENTTYNIQVKAKDNALNEASLSTVYALTTALKSNSDFDQVNLESLFQFNELSNTVAVDEMALMNGTRSGGTIALMSNVGLHYWLGKGNNVNLNRTNVTGGKSVFTLGMWITFNSISGYAGFFGDYNSGGGTWLRFLPDGKIQGGIHAGGGWRLFQTATPVVPDELYLILVEFDGSTCRLLMNNTTEGSVNYSGTVDVPTVNEHLNKDRTTSNDVRVGQLFVYNKILTATQKAKIFNNGQGINL